LINFPDKVGNWKIEPRKYNDNPFNVPGADLEIIKSYRDASNRLINLYIGYFESQRQDKELVTYQLDWLYKNAQEIELSVSSKGSIKVNRTIFRDGANKAPVLFWYDVNGRIIANNIKAKVITAIDGLVRRRTNGAVVIISGDLNNSGEVENILEDEVEFVESFLPIISNYLS
jgi:EpsI family protein